MKRTLLILLIGILVIGGVYYQIDNMDKSDTINIEAASMEEEVYLINNEKTYINTNLDSDYIEINILEDNRIMVKGKTTKDYNAFMVDILTPRGDKEIYRDEGGLEDGILNFNKKYKLNEGNYIIQIYYGNKIVNKDGWVTNYLGELDTTLQVKDGSYKFPNTDIYFSNLKKLTEKNKVKRRHLSLFGFTSKEQLVLRDLAKTIIAGEEDEYKKAFLIANWVSSNIYYDYDALKSGEYKITSAIDTLKERRTICQGYANLTEALMRAADIPARRTVGYGLGGSGIENETWEDAKDKEANHIWNEVYVNGRWVIIDTTWNSMNRYENGKFEKEDSIFAYFDMTLEALADKHKITKR